MQSHGILSKRDIAGATGRVARFLRQEYERDTLTMIGLPLLIVVGAILGVINLLACIHLIAVLLNG